MPDVFLGDLGIDVDAPVVDTRVPANLSTSIARGTNIYFNITDVGGSGVDLLTLDVSVGGVPAIVSGVFQVGFLGSITSILDGYAVVIDPDSDFPFLQMVVVTVDASDLSPIPNAMTTDSWSFTVLADNVPPAFSNLLPADLSINVPLGTNISFRVVDLDSPVPQSSIDLALNGMDAIIAGVAQPGYIASFVPVTGGFDVSINPTTDLTLNLLVSAVAYATDSAFSLNPASASWSFTTIVDNSLPEVHNHSPTGSLVRKTAHIKFDLTDPGIHGVDLSSVVVIVNGQNAYASGVSQNGYTAVVTTIPTGFHFDITAPSDWTLGLTVNVTINASDTAP